MSRLLTLLTILLVLSLFPCLTSSYAQSNATVEIAAADQATELQKQSDYHNRVEQKREKREMEKQVDAVDATQSEARSLDNFVMIMLVLSAGALFLISRRVRSGRSKSRPRRLPLR
jgi:hypothetical protein